MSLFINHSIEEKNNEIIVTLYVDKRYGTEEFSGEFLAKSKKWLLENEARSYVSSHLPSVKGGLVKVAFGSLILTTIPLQVFAEEDQQEQVEVSAYTVQAGDTLSQIANKFNVGIDAIKDANGLTSDMIYVNQKLLIPSTNPVNQDPEMESPTDENQATGNETSEPATEPSQAPVVDRSTYTVQAGDTLSQIANAFNVTVDQIKSANGLTGDTIYVGQELEVLGTAVTQDTVNFRVGDYKKEVIQLKKDLEKVGFKVSDNPTDYYGPVTADKVKQFQKAYHLNQTGVVNQTTLQTLQEAVRETESSTILREGTYHRSVIQLKMDLEKAGFNVSDNPTDYYGPVTADAVKAFQKRYGLVADGIAGPNTLEKLGEVISVLKVGDYRPEVIELKMNLEKVGLKVSNNPTDYYGQITAEKVKEFQRKYGLTVTGMADSNTINTLKGIVAGNAETDNQTDIVLKDGVYHDKVIQLKIDLESIGIKVSDNPTDFYGPVTASKVKEFQRRYNLTVDGIAGKETLDKLQEVMGEAIPAPFKRIMQLETTGEDVRLLQTYLNEAGFKVVDQPTTYYGTQTANKVKEFQQQNGLTPNGVADARTLQKLITAREGVVEKISSFRITGKGYGHSVGMTQWGAYGMAASGHTYEDILKYYYTGTGIGMRDTSNQNVRVLLAEKKDVLSISSNQPYQVGDKEFLPQTTTTIKYLNGKFVIENSGKTYQLTTPFQISQAKEGVLYFNNKQYEGTFSISTTDNKLNLVNHLNVENYLKGVVPYEIIPSWDNLNLFKVQTLAARTYVLKEIQRNQSKHFDVYDTVRSQVYNGVPNSIPERYVTKINQAISDTKGEVVLYNGALIDAVYSASAGGHTVDAVDVWGNHVPYLIGKEDPYDQSNYASNWYSYSISKAELEKLFPTVGKVIHVSVMETKYNRPTKIKIAGEKAEIIVSGTTFRQKIGTDKIASSTFTIEGMQ
ncbi:peptidoglycan-binding protein [Oceanobacillus bengalensis]|uniref:peptidoglycan-binding protein n=1 Tax=Oceanobacillus bengalensis TaxID=1435466 RepID=UPI003632E5F6